MPLQQDIDAAIKEFAAAIKDAEDRKKETTKAGAEILKASSAFSAEVKQAAAALAKAEKELEIWDSSSDSWIAQMKSLNTDFATYKKKSAAVEKFYGTLQDEKDERDKARKKQGAGTKPSKEDEIADAAFKRAKAAYDNDPGRMVESQLKQIAQIGAELDAGHKARIAELKEAAAGYEAMSAAMIAFMRSLSFKGVKSWAVNEIDTEFDNYFKKFK